MLRFITMLKPLSCFLLVGRLAAFTHTDLPAGKTRRCRVSLTKIASSPVTEADNDNNSISLVTVCMGELCRCQEGEGVVGAEAIYQELSERGQQQQDKLPFEVETSICLGACGLDPVVAIDYEDGTSFLAYGYQETLQELGLSQEDHSTTTASPTSLSTIADETSQVSQKLQPPSMTIPSAAVQEESEKIVAGAEQQQEKEEASDVNVVTILKPKEEPTPQQELASERVIASSSPSVSTTTTTTTATTKTTLKNTNLGGVPQKLEDARDRMRASNTNNADRQEQPNPWAQAALYLAQKAQDKLFFKS